MTLERLLALLVRPARADAPPARGVARLHRETVVAAPLRETFAFFSDAGNLERLTPAWLRFRIRTPTPVTMREGLEIEYRIVLHGIPIPWRTRIDAWEPGVRFVDRQIVGPYRWWHHEHRFEEVPGGTKVVDHVGFVPPLRWLTGWWVRRDVERIFDYRQEALKRIFGGEGAERPEQDGGNVTGGGKGDQGLGVAYPCRPRLRATAGWGGRNVERAARSGEACGPSKRSLTS